MLWSISQSVIGTMATLNVISISTVQSLDNCVETLIGTYVLSQFVQVLDGPLAARYHALDLAEVVEAVLGHASLESQLGLVHF